MAGRVSSEEVTEAVARKGLRALRRGRAQRQDWLVEQGDLMDNALYWMEQAYPELPNNDGYASQARVSVQGH